MRTALAVLLALVMLGAGLFLFALFTAFLLGV